MQHRAHALLSLKAISEDERIIEGIASTIAVDRMGDIVEPKGAEFKLPIPLLWQHDARAPIGEVFAAKTTADGITIKARILKTDTPGQLKERLDLAWESIKLKLVRGLSIGFQSIESARIDGTYGMRFTKWLWLELSAVTIAANQQATITAIKSISDTARLAASGTGPRIPSTPGVAGFPQQGTVMENISQQVTAAKTELQTKSARLSELITQDQNEGGLDAALSSERDTLKVAVKSLTSKIDDLATLEAAQAATAATIAYRPTEPQRVQLAQPQLPKVEVKSLPKGTLFTRYAMAVAAGKGSYSDTIAYAKRWEGETPELVTYVKSLHGKAIEGTTVLNSPAWGSQLVFQDNLASEFVELLRPRTIMGRISGLRMVPFNVRIPTQTDGATVNWVGESGVKPISDLGFDTITMPYHKIAGIVVLTEELVRLSTPNAEETVRRDLVEQIARFMDQQWIDTTVTATASRPASITNGVASPAASGTTIEDFWYDMNLALATFDSAEVSTESIVVLMTPALARGISTLRNALGQFEFTGMTATGGTLMGFPVIVSSNVPSGTIVLVAANEILVADDGRVTLDASNQATLDMAGGSSPTFSLWQKDCIAIRAERWVTWKKRRTASVAIIDTASYGPTAPA